MSGDVITQTYSQLALAPYKLVCLTKQYLVVRNGCLAFNKYPNHKNSDL